MTPKEKAKILSIKFYSPLLSYKDGLNINEVEAMQECAKQCALIAVDEILNTLDSERIIYGSEYCFEENKYWNEVKQEIEKL